MRLTIVISSLAGGGAERAVSEMANCWARSKCDVTIITWDHHGDQDAYRLDPSVERVRLGLRRHSTGWWQRLSGALGRIASLRAALRRSAPDVVLSFTDSTNVLSILATRGMRIPILIAERSDPQSNATVNAVWRLFRRLTYRWADRVIAQTRSAGDWLDANCGTRALVIPNLLRELPDPGSSMKRDRIVLAVGRLAWEKDVETLIRGFAIAHRRHAEWTLALVGEGPLKGRLMDLAVEVGVGKVTRFAGFSTTPEQWMARAGLFVLSSRFEGFPNALLEAMAMGMAVVSSDCPSGPREIVANGENGRLFPVGDAQGLADILVELMSDPTQRTRLGTAALRVRETYSRDRVMELWNQAIRAASVRKDP